MTLEEWAGEIVGHSVVLLPAEEYLDTASLMSADDTQSILDALGLLTARVEELLQVMGYIEGFLLFFVVCLLFWGAWRLLRWFF